MRHRRVIILAAIGALATATPAVAQNDDDAVVVSATRSERRSLDVPVSIDTVGGDVLREGKPKVNLSESLGSVPGLVVQNRQNYAQDLQLSIRGFGARSTFGIRGVKLYADGIPATMPDGQGQAANFDLSSAQRIEVMRGPVASLYGNSSGGVIQLFTADGPEQPTVGGDFMTGSYGTRRIGAQAGGESGPVNGIADWWRFHTDGYRAHSSANREQFNSKLNWAGSENTRVTAVVNTLDQPDTQDPLGLTRAQVNADPRQADASATTFNTRKSVRQEQGGAVIEHRLDAGNRLRVSAYDGNRQVRQFLALTGSGPTSSGGVVDLGTDYGGASLTWLHKGTLFGQPLAVTTGLERETEHQRRRGYVNNSGVMGDLRRDEDDLVQSDNLFAQADWRFTERASLTLGARRTNVAFSSYDHFIVGANPDDSGAVTYSNTSPVAGLNYRLAPEMSLYASAGHGFETPSFSELAYQNSGTGLNFALKPSRSSTVEVGLKGRIAEDHRITLARFETDTRDEIVIDTSTGGRTVYKNASRTQREGWELSWQSLLPKGFDSVIAYTRLDARYSEAFTSGSPAATVPVGNFIPGIPRTSLYGELRWRHFGSGFSTALEARHNGQVFVDDANSDSAAAYTVANWRAGFEQKRNGWRFTETVRVDNLTDRNYVGSVIVADTNSRFFEPAPRRGYTLLIGAQRTF